MECDKGQDKMTGYMTKYALTTGIEEVIVDSRDGGYVYCRIKTATDAYGLRIQLREGRDFFMRKEDAEENARKQAERKVVALKNNLRKMEALSVIAKWAKR